MKATALPHLGPVEHGPPALRGPWHGGRTLKDAEMRRLQEQAQSKHPRVDALTGNVRYSYQHAVEMTELAKRLEQELTQAKARIQTLETIGKAARQDAPKERLRTPREMNEAVADLENLTNDEVYSRLKRYRCFGMTTRVTED